MKRIVLELQNSDADHLSSQSKLIEGRDVLESLRTGNENSVDAVIVGEGVVIQNLEKKLRSLRDKFSELQESGIPMEMLEAYVRVKCGVNKTDFDNVMRGVKEFFNELE